MWCSDDRRNGGGVSVSVRVRDEIVIKRDEMVGGMEAMMKRGMIIMRLKERL